MTRTYKQGCMLAHALDYLGERWTLLIVRDLLLGPRGFADLQNSLKGIGGSLLSKRLKDLEDAGVVAADMTDGKRNQYRLTELGEHLRPSVRALMRWSVRFTRATIDNAQIHETMMAEISKPDSVALGLEMYAEYQREPALRYVAHLIVDGRPYSIYYMNGDMTVKRGADTPAMARIETDSETALKGLRRLIDANQARKLMKADGDARVLDHLFVCIASKRREVATPAA